MPKKSNLKKSKTTKKRTISSSPHGIDHDFIMIAGGGFILLVLILLVLYR